MKIPPFTPRLWQWKIDRLIRLLGLTACALSLTVRAPAQDRVAAASSDLGVLKPVYGAAWGRDFQPDLADFHTWAQAFVKAQKAGEVADAANVTMGVRLAERRRFVLAALVQTDPARALAVGVPPAVRAKLPAEVVSHLETPFSTTGDYSMDGQSGRRQITVDGRAYGAHVYGRRTALGSLRDSFLHGFLLDGEAVLDANVLGVVPANAADGRFLADGGGTTYRFGSFAQIRQAETDLRALETHAVNGGLAESEKTALGKVASMAGTRPAAGAQTARAPQPQNLNGNDFFANAYPLPGANGSVFDNNIGATKEPGEPDHAGDAGGASVWYVWIAPSTGDVTIATDDNAGHSEVDTLLAAYTGTNVAQLSTVASNDDYDGLNSQITFLAQSGVAYHIAVDGYLYSNGPSEGSYTLSYFQEGNADSPTITSDSTVEANVNAPFLFTIVATNSPTSYDATGLPTGLSINRSTGVISGTPTAIGSSDVIISATNSDGTGSSELFLAVTDQPIHFAFFRTEVALPESPGIYYLHLYGGNIFGYYAYLSDQNYIYHLDLGYEYTFDANDGEDGIYFYDFASDTFFYTSPLFPFPYLYDFKLNTTLYYFHSPTDDSRFNTNGIRYFYDFATDQIITK